jgi:hypothetical protein
MLSLAFLPLHQQFQEIQADNPADFFSISTSSASVFIGTNSLNFSVFIS